MKRAIITYLLFMIVFQIGYSQNGNYNDQFVLTLETPEGHKLAFHRGECGISYSQFGPPIDAITCGEAIWAVDINGDSTCCSQIDQDLTGKIALIRRGDCSFSEKVFRAQQAGAVGAVVVNHELAGASDSCTVLTMASIGPNTDSVNIPNTFLSKKGGDQILDILASSTTGELCFKRLNFLKAYGAHHYGTPSTQVDTLKHMGVRIKNYSTDTLRNLELFTRIKGPLGLDTSFVTLQNPVLPEKEADLFSSPWCPPPEQGLYTLEFSTNQFSDHIDTLYSEFRITNKVFASDRMELWLDGGYMLQQGFPGGYIIYQTGSLYRTGSNGAIADRVEFGITNVDSVYSETGGNEANSIFILLYDADADGDGQVNLTADWSDISSDLVAFGQYIMNGNEKEEQLICQKLYVFPTGNEFPELKPNHKYYVSMLYDGNLVGTGRSVAFTNTRFVQYYDEEEPINPFFWGQFYPLGWANRNIVQRLLLKGAPDCQTSSVKAPFSQNHISVYPNPVSNILHVKLDLGQSASYVKVSIFNAMGEIVRQTQVEDYGGLIIQLDVQDLPGGNYILVIDSDAGYSVQPVVVAH